MSPKDNNKQVSAAVRILHQKRDASARATHLMVKNDSLITYEKAFSGQAVIKKFFIATFLERKKMSTKTSFKRIALVAAAALAIGGFSAVSPAKAAAGAPFEITTYETRSAAGGASLLLTATQVAGADNYIEFTATASTYGASAFARVAVTGSTISSASNATLQNAAYTTVTDGSATVATYAADYDLLTSDKVRIPTKTAGTITVSVTENAVSAGQVTATEVQKFTITVLAAGISGVPSAANSTVAVKYTAAAGAAYPTTDATATTVSAASGTAYIYALPKDGSAAKAALAATADVKVSVTSGTCLVSDAIAANGKGKVYTLTALNADGTDDSAAGGGTKVGFRVDVTGDGSGIGGACVIVIDVRKDGATAYTTLATKTITFFGTVASLSYTKVKGVISDTSSGVANTDTDIAAIITAKDAGGNAVTINAAAFTQPTAVEDAAAGITDSAIEDANADVTVSGVDVAAGDPVLIIDASATKTGAKSLTLTHTATKLTVVVPFTVGLDEATTVSLSADKSSYSAGEKMVLTLTALGSDGLAIADTSAATDLLATGGIASSLALQGDTTTATNPALVGGKKSWNLYAPLAAGPLTFDATTGAAAGSFIATAGAAKAITATVEITGDSTVSLALDAANAATDAANNAYDEAQNATQAASDALAAVTALAAQVKSLIASVKKLTAAVAKLKK